MLKLQSYFTAQHPPVNVSGRGGLVYKQPLFLIPTQPGSRSAPQYSSETEVKAGAIEKVALIAISVSVSQALDEDWLEPRHIVIKLDGAEGQVIAYVEIKPAANQHGKRVCIIDEPLRDCGIPDRLRGARNFEAA
jgi:hypothetical protein